MSAYSPKELDRLWRQEQITAEQAVGHLVQLILALQQPTWKNDCANSNSALRHSQAAFSTQMNISDFTRD